MAIKTMFPASSERPQSQYAIAANIVRRKSGFAKISGSTIATLKDNFHLKTWILLGCVLQSILYFIFPRSYAAFPAIALLAWSFTDALLMHFGLKKDKWYEGVVNSKFSVAYPGPGESDVVRTKPGENGPGAVMILGARSNSPLGMFADGMEDIGRYFNAMIEDLEKNREESGFMGVSSWISSERSAANEFSTFSYWRSVDDIHRFALGEVHRKAWNWWNDTAHKHKNVGIMHEIFAIPEHHGWEGIYINYHPTGLAATTKVVEGSEKNGQKLWVNPIVDARKGQYRTSMGRLNHGDPQGQMNDSVAVDPYL